ncbi:MAG: glycosyltransferase family 2 protein [Phycisphaerales bacterium]|nr:glycosyltransferase family 2 protein [Phycisphaerales bacterium]
MLIPAHDEEGQIRTVLARIALQLAEGDRLVVVADNCTDRTAEVAWQAGATVIERSDSERRGKGFALDCGIRFLEAPPLSPPSVVLLMDADCLLGEGSLDLLCRQAERTGRPVQARYLMKPPADPSPRDLISAFAFLVKNHVRPLACRRMGIPCLLTGTGMALPWTLIRTAPLASGNIVEDMQLGLDLAIAGHAPIFCEGAEVTGQLPAHNAAAASQRRRWEHGHLQTLLHNVPRLLWAGLRRGQFNLVGQALDVCIPPLALLMVLWVTAISLAIFAAWMLGISWWSAILLACGGGLLGISVLAAWAKFARHILPLSTLLAVPFYILWKLPLYTAFLFRRQKTWIRTAR